MTRRSSQTMPKAKSRRSDYQMAINFAEEASELFDISIENDLPFVPSDLGTLFMRVAGAHSIADMIAYLDVTPEELYDFVRMCYHFKASEDLLKAIRSHVSGLDCTYDAVHVLLGMKTTSPRRCLSMPSYVHNLEVAKKLDQWNPSDTYYQLAPWMWKAFPNLPDMRTIYERVFAMTPLFRECADLVVAGGALLKCFLDEPWSGGDVDYWISRDVSPQELCGMFHAELYDTEWCAFDRTVRMKLRGRPEVQNIIRWDFDCSDEIPNSFDFDCLEAYYDGHLHVTFKFLECVRDRTIMASDSMDGFTLNSLGRIPKYEARGFDAPKGCPTYPARRSIEPSRLSLENFFKIESGMTPIINLSVFGYHEISGQDPYQPGRDFFYRGPVDKNTHPEFYFHEVEIGDHHSNDRTIHHKVTLRSDTKSNLLDCLDKLGKSCKVDYLRGVVKTGNLTLGFEKIHNALTPGTYNIYATPKPSRSNNSLGHWLEIRWWNKIE